MYWQSPVQSSTVSASVHGPALDIPGGGGRRGVYLFYFLFFTSNQANVEQRIRQPGPEVPMHALKASPPPPPPICQTCSKETKRKKKRNPRFVSFRLPIYLSIH